MSRDRVSRAVVLARGAGHRMQARDDGAVLTAAQAMAAARGEKAMMPIGGRPFLDRVLDALAGAGLTDVALVVAPDHRAMREAYEDRNAARGRRLSWIVQAEPRGTADAVLAVESWVRDEPFVTLNGDNLYPVAALTALAEMDGPALAAFESGNLAATSNISADRLATFALIELDASGVLLDLIEKPGPAIIAQAGAAAVISMNLWRFDRRIFAACRDVTLSARGEYELPLAVKLAVSRGVRFQAVRVAGPVLDLSRRSDVADVTRRLACQ